MSKILNTFLNFLCILILNLAVSYAQSCNNYSFSNNEIYTFCVSLPVLNSDLYWNYHSDGTIDVAFHHPGSTPSQWVAWGLNVNGSGMIGAQAIVAVTSSSGLSRVYTSAINGYDTGLEQSSLSFYVPRMRLVKINGDLEIYANLVLPGGRTRFNHVWQVGPVDNGSPSVHPLSTENKNSIGEVDFSNGQTSAAGGGNVGGGNGTTNIDGGNGTTSVDGGNVDGGNGTTSVDGVNVDGGNGTTKVDGSNADGGNGTSSIGGGNGTTNVDGGNFDGGSVDGWRQRMKNTHGLLNAVSWGVLMPMGAMSARYIKVFNVDNSAWFYIHAATQTSAYIIGGFGWATGLKLGSDSNGIRHNSHRNIGIVLFVFGTIQVCALLLRPKPDNKYRPYWDMYHRCLGYCIIILSIVNLYKGFNILAPKKNWKNDYTRAIIFLGIIALVFEGIRWLIVGVLYSRITRNSNRDELPLFSS